MQDETGQRRAKILVVDDNAENRALARATLEDEDYDVLVASDGEEALRVFAAEQPDCVLLDVRMPGMDGFAVCARLRELPVGSDTPVVFLTALRDLDTFDAALRAGGDDFMTKPVRPTELVLRVQAALRLGRLSAANREYHGLVRRQRDDLMRLQLQQERLTAFVVHDLKNPVAAVDLQAQVLLREKDLSARGRAAATNIRDEVRALSRLISNLLDISRAEEGRLTPRLESIDLGRLLRHVLDAFEARAAARNVSLASNIGVGSVRGDPDLLRRVLENLLDNAVRHAPEHTTVEVVAKACPGACEISVADAGVGVPPELCERIFERYVRVDGAGAATRSGHGLGLAFCRLAIEAHAGKIWLENGAPGAVFRMRLPDGSG